jgi:spermidine synthase
MNKTSNFLKKIGKDLWLIEDERDNMKISYRIKNIIFEGKSKFQHIMILDSYDFGKMLVLDGVVQTTAKDGYIYNEMISHLPLNIHPNPKNILIIGGGDCGVAKEVLKYDIVENLDMVEIDEMVVDVCRKYLQEVSGNISDNELNFLYTDGIEYVKKTSRKYDVIIVDSSDPVGPAQALIELSFYKDLYRILNNDGLMVCQSQSPIMHRNITKQTYNRLDSIFPKTKLYYTTVPTYPGGFWSFTLATKKYHNINTNNIKSNTFFVNSEVLSSSFNLPNIIKKIIK